LLMPPSHLPSNWSKPFSRPPTTPTCLTWDVDEITLYSPLQNFSMLLVSMEGIWFLLDCTCALDPNPLWQPQWPALPAFLTQWLVSVSSSLLSFFLLICSTILQAGSLCLKNKSSHKQIHSS
jgi:hypothetical protein